MTKVMTTREAVTKFVADGDMVYIGGYICRPPFAAVHEIIRQRKKNLTVVRSNAADDFDMMIGAGVVSRFIGTFLSLGVYGLGRCYRRSIEKGIPRKIEIEEYTNLSLPLMLMAGSLGMPFVPVNDMKGSDLLNVRSFMGDGKYKIIDSPFDGKPTVLVPAKAAAITRVAALSLTRRSAFAATSLTPSAVPTAGRPSPTRGSALSAAETAAFVASASVAITTRTVLRFPFVCVELRLCIAEIGDPLRRHAQIGEVDGRRWLGSVGH